MYVPQCDFFTILAIGAGLVALQWSRLGPTILSLHIIMSHSVINGIFPYLIELLQLKLYNGTSV